MSDNYGEDKKITEVKVIREYINTTCDRCGSVIPDGGTYDSREFEVSFYKGSSYPDSGNKKGWIVEDLCDNCVGWLLALLEVNGVKVKRDSVDW